MAKFKVFKGAEEREWPLPWNERIVFVVRRAGYVPYARWAKKHAMEKMAGLAQLPTELVDEIFSARQEGSDERVVEIFKRHKVSFIEGSQLLAELGSTEVPGEKAALLVAEVKGERLDEERDNSTEVVAEFLDAYPMVTQALLEQAVAIEREFAEYLGGAAKNSEASSAPATSGGSDQQPTVGSPTSEPPSDATPSPSTDQAC